MEKYMYNIYSGLAFVGSTLKTWWLVFMKEFSSVTYTPSRPQINTDGGISEILDYDTPPVASTLKGKSEEDYLKECLTDKVRYYKNYLVNVSGPVMSDSDKERINAAVPALSIALLQYVIDTYREVNSYVDIAGGWYLNIVLEDHGTVTVLNDYSKQVEGTVGGKLTYAEFNAICKILATVPHHEVDYLLRDIVTYDITKFANNLPVVMADEHISYLLRHTGDEEELLLTAQVISCWDVLKSMGWRAASPDSLRSAVAIMRR